MYTKLALPKHSGGGMYTCASFLKYASLVFLFAMLLNPGYLCTTICALEFSAN